MSAKHLLMALLVLVCGLSTAFASPYSAVVVYGDSLSDNGNLYALSGGTYPPSPPYYNGRRSDGRLAVEYLASSLGVPLVDYALIGATTGIGNYADGGTVTNIGANSLPGMTALYNLTIGSIGGGTLGHELFVVWGGPNDVLAPSPLDATPQDIIARAVANELAIIMDLRTRGAYRILVPGMPDLGLTPDVILNGDPVAASALTAAFNATLLSLLPPDVIFFDTAALMHEIAADPGAFGLTNVTDACYDTSVVSNVPCANPENYLFFDLFHPTTAASAIFAQGFLAAVPEPSTWTLLMAGFVLFLWLRRDRAALSTRGNG